MGNIFGGSNSFINRAGRDINRSVITATNQASRSVSANTQGLIKQAQTTLRDTQNLQREVSRGEIGRIGSNVANTLYAGATTIPRIGGALIGRGNLSKEVQKTFGGYLQTVVPSSAVVGNSSGAQKLLRYENLSKNTFGLTKNYAGSTSGIVSLTNQGTISNSDRNDLTQFGVKVGGGVATAGFLSWLFAPSSVAPGVGAVEVASGPGYIAEGAITTSEASSIGIGASEAAAVGVTDYATYAGATAITANAISTIATGKKVAGDLQSIFNPGSSPGINLTNPLYPQIGSDVTGGMGSSSVSESSDATTFYVYAGLAAVVGFYLYKRYV